MLAPVGTPPESFEKLPSREMRPGNETRVLGCLSLLGLPEGTGILANKV